MSRAPRLASLSFGLAGLALAATSPATPADFSLASLDGAPVTLSDQRGKWVVVNFWATWCSPCLGEIRELVRFHDASPERVVLGVDFEKIERSALRRFVKKHGIDYPVLLIGNQKLESFEPLMGLPTTAVVNPAGEIVAYHPGPVTASGARAAHRAAVGPGRESRDAEEALTRPTAGRPGRAATLWEAGPLADPGLAVRGFRAGMTLDGAKG